MLNTRYLCNFKALQNARNTTPHDTPRKRLVEAFARLQSQCFKTHKHLIIIILCQF